MLRIVSASRRPMWQWVLDCLVRILASGNLLQFMLLSCFRLFYPFELEWIEGACVDQARWLMEGHRLYAEPSIHMVPTVYNPLFFLASAISMKVVGVGFTAPRLISILSTLGCVLLLYWIVARETRNASCGFLAAGIYVAAFRFAGAWMDLAKPDSMFLFIILSAFSVTLRHPNRWSMIIGGFLYTLAYYTKQNALPIMLVVAPVSLLASRGRTWIQWLCVLLVGSVTFGFLDAVSDGWFSFYTFDMVIHHTIVPDIWSFWYSVVQHMWPALLLSLLYLISVIVRAYKPAWAIQGKDSWHIIGLGIALLMSSWSVSLQRWTYDNVFMPASAGVGMLAGLGWSRLLEWMRRPSQPRLNFLPGLGGVLLLCQFAILFYNPFDQVPSETSRRIWEQFIGRLHDHPGEVLIFNHGFAGYMAGKSTFLHSSSYSDAVGGGASAPRSEDNRWRRDRVRQVLEQAIRQQTFDWVFAGESSHWLPYYLPADEEPVVFYPVTGPPAGREVFFIKNPVARGGVLLLSDTRFGFLLQEGWSIPETWGRWAIGRQAALQIALEEGRNYELSIEAFPFCPPEFAEQTMKVGWNALPLGTHVFTSCESQWITFDLPAQVVAEGFGTLRFDFETAIAPAEVGLSGDGRPLAVGFVALHFAQE